MASAVPKTRDLEYFDKVIEGEEVVVVHDPVRNTWYRFNLLQAAMLRAFDGKRGRVGQLFCGFLLDHGLMFGACAARVLDQGPIRAQSTPGILIASAASSAAQSTPGTPPRVRCVPISSRAAFMSAANVALACSAATVPAATVRPSRMSLCQCALHTRRLSPKERPRASSSFARSGASSVNTNAQVQPMEV